MEETLVKLDSFFASKKDKMAYFLGAAILTAFLVYLASWEISEDFFNSKVSSLASANNKYASLKDPNLIKNDIQKQKNYMVSYDKKYKKYQRDNNYLNNSLEKLSDTFFYPNGVNQFLDIIAQKAGTNSIKINEILNLTQDVKNLEFAKLYNINVKFNNANFKNIVSYVNSLEAVNRLIDIDKLDMNASKTDINGSFNIISWGVKY